MRIMIITLLIMFVKGNDDLSFPHDFHLGAATASYQIEGAWNLSGKGESVWDWFTHTKPWIVADKKNGDVACDSFHKYKEDVAILKDIGFHFYRFSISWTRILPNGFPDEINQAGIKYYHDLIDELKSNGIEPFVTIYHWDHPEALEKMGGWTNELMVDWFEIYSRIVFQEYANKVKFFATINEPDTFCSEGYGGSNQAPGINMPKYAKYLCMHNVLKAHARVYHIYDDEFRKNQNGKIGIVIPCAYFFGKDESDTLTPDIAFEYMCGWTANPIFSKNGDYPQIMKDRIDENSRIEGWPMSRLPKFTKEEVEYIKNTSDYFGLNHYTSYVVSPLERENGTLWYDDRGYNTTENPKWPGSASAWLKVVPEGMRKVLLKIKEHYENPFVHITENGFSDRDGLNDVDRLNYYYSYMKQMFLAVKDGCNVKSFMVWSLLDNFEWDRGYTERFGLVHVDFNDPGRKRTCKNSARWFKDIIKARKLLPVNNYIDTVVLPK